MEATSKRDMIWNPPIELSGAEQRIAKRAISKRKLFVFLRQHRHLIFDEPFEQDLIEMYRQTGAGLPAHPPAMMAMATILQKYAKVSDNEAVELSCDSKRWQMVLDNLDSHEPAFSQSVFFDFRMRLMATGMDERILERSAKVARDVGGLSERSVRIALDSSPLQGAGRVEDTINLIAHATRKVIDCVATLTQLSVAQITAQMGLDLFEAPSIKAALDLDWSDPEQKAGALDALYQEVEALQGWLADKMPTEATKPPLSQTLAVLSHFIEQDTEPDPAGGRRIKKGVARDRRISVQDQQMRHGRKSSTKRFDGFKRHIARDIDERLILSVEVTEGNQSDAVATGFLLEAVQEQGRSLTSLHIDRQYLHAPEIKHLDAKGVLIVCRAPGQRNNQEIFTKRDFKLDMQAMAATCPAGQKVQIELGKTVNFPASVCDKCELRQKCTKRALGKGRSLAIHEFEPLHQHLEREQSTSQGRAALRQRVDVEHSLAHVSQRQGNQARYTGVRKNLFELRMVAAIQNLERAQALLAA